MRFLNFEFATPNHTVELDAFGLRWDLHNVADFTGLQLTPDASAIVTWVVPDTPNPWGDTCNHYGGLEFRFRELRKLVVTGPDRRMPPSEGRTLAEISRLIESTPQNQIEREESGPHLSVLFRFQSGAAIELDAAEAELVPIKRELS